ncbi:MAG TPA: hypothetical protein VL173_08880 [Vicinamibacterales bacterium]|nr:hypothetical protein [Vicinamibacterales bacterium]
MDLIGSLCDALEQAAADAVVLREGQPPHVAKGDRRHDIGQTPLTNAAVQALAGKMLSSDAQRTLQDVGVVEEPLQGMAIPLRVRGERRDGQLVIELRRIVVTASPAPAPAPQELEEVEVVVEVPEAPAAVEAPAVIVEHFHGSVAPVPVTAPLAVAAAPISTEPAAVAPPPAPAPVAAPPASVAVVAPPVTEPQAPVFVAPPPAAVVPPPVVAPPAPVIVAAAPVAMEPPSVAPQPPPVAMPEAPIVPPAPAVATEPRAAAQSTELGRWIARAAERSATALYVRAGEAPALRIAERIEVLDSQPVDAAAIERVVSSLTNGGEPNWRAGREGEWITAAGTPNQIICRTFKDDQGAGFILSLPQASASTALHRRIPRFIRGACETDGLIVVSSIDATELRTMASAVADYSGRRRGGFVVALRPTGTASIKIAGAFVSQREFGNTDADAAAQIRHAALESPDVLLVLSPAGDLAIRAVLQAATGGRVVILGVTAPTTIQALQRVSAQHEGSVGDNRALVAQTFRGGFGFRALRRPGGGRTYVHDLVTPSADMSKLLTTGAAQGPEISALLSMGDFAGANDKREPSSGVVTLEQDLARAVVRGRLSLRQAVTQADSRRVIAIVRAMRRRSRHAGSNGAGNGTNGSPGSHRAAANTGTTIHVDGMPAALERDAAFAR